jgi:6-phosphofructokinase
MVQRLAVLTSGGDSSGMNPAIRAVVRSALARKADVFAIFEGYQGLVEGGSKIRHVDWSFVSGIMNKVYIYRHLVSFSIFLHYLSNKWVLLSLGF